MTLEPYTLHSSLNKLNSKHSLPIPNPETPFFHICMCEVQGASKTLSRLPFLQRLPALEGFSTRKTLLSSVYFISKYPPLTCSKVFVFQPLLQRFGFYLCYKGFFSLLVPLLQRFLSFLVPFSQRFFVHQPFSQRFSMPSLRLGT